jgi:hypothetical protein
MSTPSDRRLAHVERDGSPQGIGVTPERRESRIDDLSILQARQQTDVEPGPIRDLAERQALALAFAFQLGDRREVRDERALGDWTVVSAGRDQFLMRRALALEAIPEGLDSSLFLRSAIELSGFTAERHGLSPFRLRPGDFVGRPG